MCNGKDNMTKYIVANWKSHNTLQYAEKWLDVFSKNYRPTPRLNVIIAPPSIFITPLRLLLSKYRIENVCLAAQDISPFPMGAYTGAVAADMLKDLVEYAIVGHSERRRHFHESNQEIANKVTEAVSAGIKPILCVDKPYARSQIAALEENDMEDMLIGYGPVEAIGLDIPESSEEVKVAVELIGSAAPGRPILYGGSINLENASQYAQIQGIDGLMVGSSCLDPEKFAGICGIVASI